MWGCLWIVILITTCASFLQESVPLKIDMAAIRATATLYPDVHGDAKAKYSIDGDKRIGSSGASGWDKCASTRVGVNFLVLRYLKVDLGQMYYVSTITLHLRDNTGDVNRQWWQNGLAVELTNSSNGERGGPQCGDTYNAAKNGQSPTFPCSKAARYILITLRRRSNPVQICEVEAFGEVRGCKDPNNLPNGKYEISQGRGFGSRVTFTCNIGYKLQGKNTAHCQRPGKWSVEQPSCQPIPCKTPVNPRNGSYQLVDNRKTYGSRVLFQCNPNYHLSGQNTAQCQADGTWSPSNQPLCIAHCEASDPANGYVVLPHDIDKSRVPLMAYVTYKCHNWDGYVIEGDYNLIQCKRPGRWSDLAPTCSLANCGNPENPVNGTCTATKTTYGSNKTCSCNHGYRLSDPYSATTTCQIANVKPKWRGPTPSCQLVICDDLSGSRITYGKVIFNGQLHGNTTEYKCNEGYELIGDVKRECQRNDSWSGKKPSCKIKMCKGLSHPPNGSISSDRSRPYGSIVSYTCNSGYELQYGSSVRKCLATGQWNGIQPICQSKCASKECKPFRECKYDPAGSDPWVCLDQSKCPSEFDPVCGTDGVTYNNKCLMKVLSCQNNKSKTVEVAKQGECRYGGICTEGKPSPPTNGKCRAYLYRYWFNKSSGLCERYVYGGCFEGRNSFYTIEDCQETCVKTDPCTLPFSPGNCTNYKPRYFFNSASQTCENFHYGGCFGNENNFKDKSYCSKKCCVCETRQDRRTANNQHDAVLLLRITSVRLETRKQRVARYKAKIVKVCGQNEFAHRKKDVIAVDDIALLEVNEHRNNQTCLCPKLRKSLTYKVGVDISGFDRSERTWDMEVPLDYYVKVATDC